MDQWQSLLERFLRNECTVRENKIVYYLLRDGLIDDALRRAIDAVISDQDGSTTIDTLKPVPETILHNIRDRMEKTKPKPVARHRQALVEWLKIAAAVIITLSVSWLVFHTEAPKETVTSMNTIRVPAGQTVNMTLADGTNIWLNARTTMRYPSVFTGNKREVILDGEGFFDVAHDSNKPFMVHTDKYDIIATGTQFNVEDYKHETGFTGSLFEGAIRITSTVDTIQMIDLSPDYMARLHEGRLVAEKITDLNHYRWREGLISFKDMPFTHLMEKFEKCYGITIVIQNKRVNNYAPTGKFRQSDGVDYALRVLQRDFNFRFERDEENHTIYIK